MDCACWWRIHLPFLGAKPFLPPSQHPGPWIFLVPHPTSKERDHFQHDSDTTRSSKKILYCQPFRHYLYRVLPSLGSWLRLHGVAREGSAMTNSSDVFFDNGVWSEFVVDISLFKSSIYEYDNPFERKGTMIIFVLNSSCFIFWSGIHFTFLPCFSKKNKHWAKAAGRCKMVVNRSG